MVYRSEQERDERIKELEGFRDDWQKMIDANEKNVARLSNLPLKNVKEFEEALKRAAEAGQQLSKAKMTIEATIERVRQGGY